MKNKEADVVLDLWQLQQEKEGVFIYPTPPKEGYLLIGKEAGDIKEAGQQLVSYGEATGDNAAYLVGYGGKDLIRPAYYVKDFAVAKLMYDTDKEGYIGFLDVSDMGFYTYEND